MDLEKWEARERETVWIEDKIEIKSLVDNSRILAVLRALCSSLCRPYVRAINEMQ